MPRKTGKMRRKEAFPIVCPLDNVHRGDLCLVGHSHPFVYEGGGSLTIAGPAEVGIPLEHAVYVFVGVTAWQEGHVDVVEPFLFNKKIEEGNSEPIPQSKDNQ